MAGLLFVQGYQFTDRRLRQLDGRRYLPRPDPFAVHLDDSGVTCAGIDRPARSGFIRATLQGARQARRMQITAAILIFFRPIPAFADSLIHTQKQ